MLIYAVENKVNGKLLIGQTIRLLCQRKGQYLYRLRKGTYCNIHFQNAFNKYGEDSFSFIVLEDGFTSRKELNEAESFWIISLRTMDPESGYNKSHGGKKCLSDDYRKRISRSLKGIKFSKERCRNISEALQGYIHTEETKRNMREAKLGPKNHFYGKEHTQKAKNKISELAKGRYVGDKNPMYGKTGKLSPASKPVLQIDKNTKEVISKFNCIVDASKHTGTDGSAISKVCRGVPYHNTAGGFIWEYAEK